MMRKVGKVIAIVAGASVALFCVLYGTIFFLTRKDFHEIPSDELGDIPDEMFDEPYGE